MARVIRNGEEWKQTIFTVRRRRRLHHHHRHDSTSIDTFIFAGSQRNSSTSCHPPHCRPYWKRPSTESYFFSVSPCMFVDINLHHPCKYQHVCICHTPNEQQKVCTPLGRPIKGKVVIIICRRTSRSTISSTHLHYHGHWSIAVILDVHVNATCQKETEHYHRHTVE